jgi:pSer/pThr/pTyr-binding forkhead associated (FHA) protein
VVIAQDGSPGRRYPLESSEIIIGSGEQHPIALKRDPYVSPSHARLTYRGGAFTIEDLGSTNGVYVRIGGSVPLRDGDMILVGLAVLKFEVIEEAERNPAPAARDGVRVFGTPPSPRYARLSLQTVEDRPRDVYHLSRAETVLGREQGDIVFTDDPFMSRRHAAIRRDPNTNHFTLRDLGSSNGTFVAIRGRHHLSPGDHLRIGQHLFRLDVRRTG